jgi:hypothetical protein
VSSCPGLALKGAVIRPVEEPAKIPEALVLGVIE